MNAKTQEETTNENPVAEPLLNGSTSEVDPEDGDEDRKTSRKAAGRHNIDAIGAAIAKKRQGEKELVALRVTLEAQLAAVKEALGEGRVLTSTVEEMPPIAHSKSQAKRIEAQSAFEHVIEKETAAKASRAKRGPKGPRSESNATKVLEYLKSKEHRNAATGLTAVVIGLANGLTPGQTASALHGLKKAVKSKGERKARVWWAT